MRKALAQRVMVLVRTVLVTAVVVLVRVVMVVDIGRAVDVVGGRVKMAQAVSSLRVERNVVASRT